MTSKSKTPALPEPKPIHRWYWPLHGATCGAVVATAVVLFLVNVPGQEVLHPDIHAEGKYGPHWEACNSYFEHGWPLTYLTRERYSHQLAGGAFKTTDRSPWGFAPAVGAVNQTAAVLNGLSAAAVLAVILVAFQLWFGRRQSAWQLRLVDLFLAVAAVSAGLGWYVWNRQEHYREIQLIKMLKETAEKARGQPYRDEGMPTWWYEMQPGGPTFLRRLVGDEPFQAFDRVVQCEFSDDAPQYAKQLRYLRVLSVNDSVTADMGRNLADMQSLEAVDFCMMNLDDGWKSGTTVLADFPTLPRLRCANLYGTGVQDADLTWLARCKSLERVDLSDTDITASGLTKLKMLKRLSILAISGPKVSDETCLQLGEFPALRELWISSSKITDEGASNLSRSSTLEKLVWDAPTTDEGLLQLANIDSLVELWVRGGNLTDDGIATFRSNKPSCSISVDGRPIP